MENTAPSQQSPVSTPSDQPETVTTPSRSNSKLTIALGASLVLAVLAGFFLAQSGFLHTDPPQFPASNVLSEHQTLASPVPAQVGHITFAPLGPSSQRGIGVYVQDKLHLISLNSEQPSHTVIEDATNFTFRTVILGESGVATSPNGEYIVYQTDQNRVGIMTADTKQKVILPEQLHVSMVGPWSPDSRRFIVKSDPQSVQQAFEGMGNPPPHIEYEKGLLPKGYYLVDIQQGTASPLAPISGFSGWIDESTIMVSTSDSHIDSSILMAFNVDSFTLETRNLFEQPEKFFSVQKSVSANGQRWALSLWPQGEDIENIQMIVADFPHLTGQIISQGSSAQSPIISPDGQTVLYYRHDVLNGPNYVEFWKDGQVTRVGEGFPLHWVSDTQFVYTTMSVELSTNANSHLNKVMLHDISNGQDWELFSL